MLVPVLGPPWAVWYTTPTWFTAGLAIGALLVVELAVLSRSWAAALRIISTNREWLVMRSYSLSCGAFHLILGPPWAVWYTTPTWFTAGLAIGALLVVELAVL